MKTSTAPSSAARPFAPSDRKLASPWIRDLKTGAAVRRCLVTGADVAFVAPSHDGSRWISIGTWAGNTKTRETAKGAADVELLAAGFRLVDVPGHDLEIE